METNYCPRCGSEMSESVNALSRHDNTTYVCSPCGTSEAIRAFMGLSVWEDFPNIDPEFKK